MNQLIKLIYQYNLQNVLNDLSLKHQSQLLSIIIIIMRVTFNANNAFYK